MAVYDIVQFGSGGIERGGVGRIYVGARFQRGHGGIGSFLSGLFRSVLPLLKSGDRAVEKEALNTGMNILSNVAAKNTAIGDSFRSRVKESGKSLKRKAEEKTDKLMVGSGFNQPLPRSLLQLSEKSRRARKRRAVSNKRGPDKKKTRTRKNHKKNRKMSQKHNKTKKRKKTRDIFD